MRLELWAGDRLSRTGGEGDVFWGTRAARGRGRVYDDNNRDNVDSASFQTAKRRPLLQPKYWRERGKRKKQNSLGSATSGDNKTELNSRRACRVLV